MRFVLTYDGPLPPNNKKSGIVQAKHDIRKQLHPQLKRQWEVEPTLLAWAKGELGFTAGYTAPPIPNVKQGAFNFTPMVTNDLSLVCSLAITFMRPDEPGQLVKPGGDIDNRLKTLFDSLTVPNMDQIKGQSPGPLEDPFYCLLEDDGLITGFDVTTERLLKAPTGGNQVHLDIAVVVRPSKVTNDNIKFLGGWL
jgi:hypothetical protein